MADQTISIGTGHSPFDPELDWSLRAYGAGTFYRQRFDYTTRAELIGSAAKCRDAWVGAPDGATPEDPPPGGAAAKIDLDTSQKRSGVASMMQRFVDGQEDFTMAGPSYAGSFNGVGTSVENVIKRVFFFQYAIMFNAKTLATPHSGTNVKQMVISGVDQGFGAGQHGFLTPAPDPRLPGGWLVRGSGFQRFQNTWNIGLPPGNGEGTIHNFVDLGPITDGALTDMSDEAHFQRRYGPTRNELGSFDSVYDFVNYPCYFKPMVWYTIMHKIDQDNDELKIWMGESDSEQPPILLCGCQNANITVSQEYTGFQAMFRPTDFSVTPFSGDDVKRWLDEIIISDQIISYPRGLTAPFAAAGSFPPGYPYGGATEDNT